jgi:hypothetical protein
MNHACADTHLQENQDRESGKMKRTASPAKSDTAKAIPESDPLSVLSRIKLAFLDEYTCEKRGYDPYDTSRGRAPDIWMSKRKRG